MDMTSWNSSEDSKELMVRSVVVLYMDNLRVHMRKDVVALYEELNFAPIMAPPYSPKYNPIEFVFAMLKHKVKKWRL